MTNDTHASTAFISMIAIVFPIHAWGPAMKDRNEKTGLKFLGGESQRFGLNLCQIIFINIISKDKTTRNILFSILTPDIFPGIDGANLVQL